MAKLSIETLNKERLKNAAGQVIYDQGQAYFRWGRVTIEQVTDRFAICHVSDSRLHQVEITVDDNYLYLRCNCNYAAHNAICKHDVAAALAVHEYLRRKLPPRWTDQLTRALQLAQEAPHQGSSQPYLLFFSLQNQSSMGEFSWKILPYKLALSALPKETRATIEAYDTEALVQLLGTTPGLVSQLRTPYNALNPEVCANCKVESVMLANILVERARAYFYTPATYLHEHLTLLDSTHSPLVLGVPGNPVQKSLQVLHQSGELRLNVNKDEGGLHLSASLAVGEQVFPLNQGEIELVAVEPGWVLADRYLFKLDRNISEKYLANWLQTPELTIPVEDEDQFLEKYYLPLAKQTPIEGETVTWEVVESDPLPRLYLSEVKGKLRAQLRFAYGDFEVSYDANLATESVMRKAKTWTLVRIQRRPDQEEAAYRSLSSSTYRLKKAPRPARPGTFILRANAHPIDFLLHSVPKLTQDGFEIFGEERLKTIQVNRSKPTLSFSISSGIDWFDVKAVINFGEIEVALKDIRRALRRKQRYIKLADGSIGEIPPDWLERYKYLFALGVDTGEGLRLSNHHLTLIDQLLADADRARTDPEFERRRQRLRDFSGIQPVPLPQGFNGELRPYQKAGYDWLHFLRSFAFGGCLADDMGLGKTVQVLVFLQSLREGCNERPVPTHADLVVVPRSLLVNWQREAARFTPNLRILEYFDKNRPSEPQVFDQHDLVITTYGVMLRDIAFLRTYPFNYVLLDESQAIKNPLAQTAKAARLLSARHRLVLTGTPVQNSSMELWSQFAFLNPGLLGNLEYFKNEFSTPIEKKGDEKAAQFLRKMVYPFILRRTKAQVAPELPPRSERTLYCDMEPAQSKLYQRTRDYYRGLVLGMLDKEGINPTRMKILEGLLRLRQIANHPRLFDAKFRGESGKFGLLLETLETLRAEGHKVLVFSQFVQMLRLVREPLDGRKIPYAYLDGHTQNRQEQVDDFQNEPDIPFFLISLRAGGLGLNLTAADYVIHIDPWWNPAVEMQATDRTHRIGQDKPVFVYKFITRDSVEEKILKLQEQKKNLVDQLVTTDSSFFKALDAEDVRVLFS